MSWPHTETKYFNSVLTRLTAERRCKNELIPTFCQSEARRAGCKTRSDWLVRDKNVIWFLPLPTRYLEACDWSVFHQATHRPSTTVHLKRFPSCINCTNIFKSLLLIHRLMGFTMQCLLCGRRSPSSGQFFLNFCRRIAPSVVNVFVRGMVLFILGAFFAMVLFMFSVLPEARRRRIQAIDLGIIANLFSAVWWIAPSSGTAAALVGIIYPCTDIRLGKPHKLEREWSSVFKCVVFFLGISHACAVSFPPRCRVSVRVI